MPDSTNHIGVAIIGAGVSGAYCAYRLAQDTSQSVEIFEANDRVGGRLWSHHWAEADATVELGGEAFSPVHSHVAGIVRTLNLPAIPHKPFNTLDRLYLRNQLLSPDKLTDLSAYPGKGGHGLPEVRYFVGQKYFSMTRPGTATDPFETVANHLLALLPPEVGKAFGDLVNGYKTRIGELTRTTGGILEPTDALKVMTSDLFDQLGAVIAALEKATVEVPPIGQSGQPSAVKAYELDFWSMVISVLGQEAYELFRNAGYDNTSALSFNFVELMENLLLGALLGMAQPGFWSLPGGFDQLPKALVSEAEKKGARLYRQLTLTRVRRRNDGTIDLTFRDANGHVHSRTAQSVIMSAPVSSFDDAVELQGFDAELTKSFAEIRKGVVKIPAGKLYMVYPDPWWTRMKDLGGKDPLNGYANTDMPSRAIYYKGTCKNGMGLMTGALTDSINVDFWTSFLSPDAQMFRGVPLDQRKDFGAPVRMVAACHRILSEIHRGDLPSDLPEPVLALYHEWRVEGAGWSAWKSGRDIHEDARHLRMPFVADGVDQKLYCCGDSVSERHGWVENTLESAESMLREAYNLAPAPWLPSGIGY